MATTLADVQTAATSLTASGNALSEAAKAIIGELQTAQTPPDFTPIVAALTSVDSQIQGAVKALQDAVAPVPPAPPAAS